MCFSASASFVASGSLAIISVASFKAADKKHKLLATVPFLFAIQQAIEGFQWLLPHPGDLCTGVGYAYLFFAFLLWPVYIPFVLSIIDNSRAKVMRGFMFAGIVLSIYILSQLIFAPFDVQIYNHSIRYLVNIPFQNSATALYIAIVCGSLFASSKASIRWFGFAFFILTVISGIFFFYVFTSVWCFFGAILSSLIYFYIKQQSKLI